MPNRQLTQITNRAQSAIEIKTVKIMVIPVGSIFRQILGMYLDTFRFYVTLCTSSTYRSKIGMFVSKHFQRLWSISFNGLL